MYTFDEPFTLELSEQDYIFIEETGDIVIHPEFSKYHNLKRDDYVIINFLDEPDQKVFPKYKVHPGSIATRLEYIGQDSAKFLELKSKKEKYPI